VGAFSSKLPLTDVFNATPLSLETGHLCTAQRFSLVKVGNADKPDFRCKE